MDTWITLLKGVNVGGNNKLPMADFRDMLAGLGCRDVVSYIQSGNGVFRAEGTADEISRAIGDGIEKTFGFRVDVFVMPLSDLQNALDANPFPQAKADPKALHLFFLANAAVEFDLTGMAEVAKNDEEFKLINGVLYFFTPNGFGKSALAGKLARFIKTSMTGRNLRSGQKILELAQSI
ncbi:MAG: DUF1697 domain-containing protein [Paracoccaceae bacterium]